MLVNQAYENMGLANAQTIETLFDGMARHSPKACGSSNAPRKRASNKRSPNATQGSRLGGVNLDKSVLLCKNVFYI